jgi:hypothetical protein
MKFKTVEACDAALAAWRKHLEEFPSNPSLLFACWYIKKTKKEILEEKLKNERPV